MSAWIEAPPSESDRAPFLLRVYLGGLGSPETLVQHVRAQREEAESLKADLEEIDARIEGSRGSYHAALTRRYGLAYAHAVIEWAETVEQELSA